MRARQGTDRPGLSRRDFVRRSVSLAALEAAGSKLYAAGSDTIKVGLIGCGGRGTGAATQVLLSTDTPVKLWAMKASKLDLPPARYEFGDLRLDPVAVPGKTPLV